MIVENIKRVARRAWLASWDIVPPVDVYLDGEVYRTQFMEQSIVLEGDVCPGVEVVPSGDTSAEAYLYPSSAHVQYWADPYSEYVTLEGMGGQVLRRESTVRDALAEFHVPPADIHGADALIEWRKMTFNDGYDDSLPFHLRVYGPRVPRAPRVRVLYADGKFRVEAL